MKPYFESNKNQTGGPEKPFYAGQVITTSEGYHIDPHWHYHMELLYMKDGTARVRTHGEELEIHEGDLLLMYPCEVHSVTVDSGIPSQHIIIGFDAELLSPMPSLAFELRYLMPYRAAVSPHRKVIHCPEESGWLSEQFSNTLEEYTEAGSGYELSVTSHIYRLMHWILRHHSHQLLAGSLLSMHPVHPGKLDAIREVLRYIDDHYQEEISASDLSHVSLMSYSHLAKLFKSVMHTPLTKYVNFVRIRKAEQLLIDPGKSIAEIAQETGFSASSYFIEQFKRTKGISPHQYRKRLLKR
ncbi:helix-turn-helix transcriptional regulator [Paenibacillus mucilaginosus]|uniref:AraC family transcriptional regulator n=3 Tax=Paenibacillus mucilaginosus TaxID=61624 RepID=H6NCQ2_9BACL|nr:AraC family transcriptional regulator [Paenibacillus mucilaginosus]AEI40352.1 transcriptional regulator, AraC family [Paenibacillus mucilaginosus KNP414]AFC28981.1 AraC family transcriptional regulator [Paenibacillus mucilaginosus 3016]AFH61206.2 AraC family transcriptional regulator [Paenibacillus mucilaginosus K02]MCG7213290.1 AraC family transcriptional regulator [Paenibacillus mucilaginosus]WDM29553.1 helix-turn-helix transcriptional regulator [Paenibacillus mucilaginosus]